MPEKLWFIRTNSLFARRASFISCYVGIGCFLFFVHQTRPQSRSRSGEHPTPRPHSLNYFAETILDTSLDSNLDIYSDLAAEVKSNASDIKGDAKLSLGSWQQLGYVPVAHPAQELEMEACGTLLCPVTGKLPEGVLFTAYSLDKSKLLHKFLPELEANVRSFKRHNKNLPACVVTNVPTVYLDGDLFDYVIQVREDLLFRGAERESGYHPQWLTRLLYYASSPFQVTLMLDGNAGFCGSIGEAFHHLSSHDFTMASSVREPCSGDHPHTFMLAYIDNEKTRALFMHWIIEQLKFGVPKDDQRPLFQALLTVKSIYGQHFRLGVFETSFASSFFGHDNANFKSWYPALTRSISTFVPIIHPVNPGPGAAFEETLVTTCAEVNRNHDEVRVVLQTSAGLDSLRQVSTPEKCDAALNTSCAGPVDRSGVPLICGNEFKDAGYKVVWSPPKKGQYVRDSSF